MTRQNITVTFIIIFLSFSTLASRNWKEWGTDIGQKWIDKIQNYTDNFLHENDYTFTDKQTFEYTFEGKGKLSVEGKIGNIYIEGILGKHVYITATKRTKNAQDLKNIEPCVIKKNNEITIKTKKEKSDSHALIDYFIQVPYDTRLKEIETYTGNINIKEIASHMNLETRAGSIETLATIGSIKARTQSGSILIHDTSGMVDAKTNSGTIEIQQDKKASTYIIARTDNGDINIFNASGSVKAITENGSIISRHTTLLDENHIKLETKNGSITTKLSKNINASLKAETKHGDIKSDFELDQILGNESKTAKGKLGTGAAKINISANCGNITIKKILR